MERSFRLPNSEPLLSTGGAECTTLRSPGYIPFDRKTRGKGGETAALAAVRFVRRLRGGCQAHLLAGSDGQYYVTKFNGNPQHRRVLVNEWVGSILFRAMGVVTPQMRTIEVSSAFVANNPGMYFANGSNWRPVRPGLHLAIGLPGQPDELATWDYLPDALLTEVANVSHFAAALVIDKWTANSDARQAIFFRSVLRRHWPESPAPALSKGLLASMIDHGYMFDGPSWEFLDAPLQGLYPRRLLYEGMSWERDIEPWLERLRRLPDSLPQQILKSPVPSAWLEDDLPAFKRLLERLWNRRDRVAGLVQDALGLRA